MMRIGLLSDTHIPVHEQILHKEIAEAFQGVDLILHAGDIYIPYVLDELEHIAPVFAALGDDDYGDILRDKRVKDKRILNLEGHTLLLLHELPYNLDPDWWHHRLSSGPGEYGNPEIVVFGHEHRTVIEKDNGTLYICPGSPTFLHYQRGLGTVGILYICSAEVSARIINL